MPHSHGFTQHYKNSTGFTLIEVLVVIAIIGILSAVVLASLNSARNKGNDAAILSDLSTVRVQAQLYYNGVGKGSYGSLPTATCPLLNAVGSTFFHAGPNGDPATNGIIDKIGQLSGIRPACWATGGAYAVQATLRAGVNGKMFWCVDSSGNSLPESAVLNIATPPAVCP